MVAANTLGAVTNAVTLLRVHDHVDWRLGTTLFLAAAAACRSRLLVLVVMPRDGLRVIIALTVLVSAVLISWLAAARTRAPGMWASASPAAC